MLFKVKVKVYEKRQTTGEFILPFVRILVRMVSLGCRYAPFIAEAEVVFVPPGHVLCSSSSGMHLARTCGHPHGSIVGPVRRGTNSYAVALG